MDNLERMRAVIRRTNYAPNEVVVTAGAHHLDDFAAAIRRETVAEVIHKICQMFQEYDGGQK